MVVGVVGVGVVVRVAVDIVGTADVVACIVAGGSHIEAFVDGLVTKGLIVLLGTLNRLIRLVERSRVTSSHWRFVPISNHTTIRSLLLPIFNSLIYIRYCSSTF